MRVQNIANSYNYQTNQNSKNHQSFKASILYKLRKLKSGDMPDADFVLKQSGFVQTFKKLLQENGVELPKKLFGNRILYARSSDKKNGVFMAIDKGTEYARKALAQLPADIEARIGASEEDLMSVFNIALTDPETQTYNACLEIFNLYNKGGCHLVLYREPK